MCWSVFIKAVSTWGEKGGLHMQPQAVEFNLTSDCKFDFCHSRQKIHVWDDKSWSLSWYKTIKVPLSKVPVSKLLEWSSSGEDKKKGLVAAIDEK